MPSVITDWLHNRIFLAWFFACLVAQITKIAIGVIRERRFDFRWLVWTGGMPSTHAAGVTALSTALGIREGVGTPLFAAALVFTIIILFDAQGVRRWSGRQAQILNKMMDDIYFKRRIQEERLKELLGHTPTQVLAGMGIGILVGWIVC